MDKSLILKEIKKHYEHQTDADFARFLGITPQLLAKWYSRKTFDIDILATKCVDIDSNFLTSGKGKMLKDNSVSIQNDGLPLIPFDIMAGYGEDNAGIMLEQCERYVIPEFENIGAEFLVRVGGSSMYPKYSSGDILACKKIYDIHFFQWGKIYVIDSSQGQMIKRICEHEDTERIWLVSDNKEKLSNDKEKYAPFSIHREEIRSLSIVVGAVRME